MISIGQIIAAGILTGIAVAIAAALARWPRLSTAAAAVGTVLLIFVAAKSRLPASARGCQPSSADWPV